MGTWRLHYFASLLLVPCLLAPAMAQSRRAAPDEILLADVLEIVVLAREVLAIDARSGGHTSVRLELNEQVLWTGTRGQVGVAITNRRVLATAARAGTWQEARYHRGETPPVDALLGERVALVVTSRRALGYDGGSGNLVEYRFGPRERVVATRVGENVGVIVTDRNALGLSPITGGFFQTRIHLVERIEHVETRSNFATVTTNRRLLFFRSPGSAWSERRLDLQSR